MDRGIGGPVLSASSYFMKSPPELYDDSTAQLIVVVAGTGLDLQRQAVKIWHMPLPPTVLLSRLHWE